MQGAFTRAAITLATVAAIAPAASHAADVKLRPCPAGEPSATCQVWTGKVTFVGDGDTLSVDVRGDGTKKPVRVRLIGVQAMEEHVYTSDPAQRVGECHANEATARVEQLVKAGNGRVRLAAQHADSTSRKRPLRDVAVKFAGHWHDIGRTLVREGHALVMASTREWAWNRSFSTLEQQAETGANLWDPEYCGAGPDAHVRVLAYADPEGPDVDGEWVKLTNEDPVNSLDLGGWWLRDSALHFLVFPSDTVLAPGATLTVWVGEGLGNAGNVFWGNSAAIFNDPNDEGMGDGAYLFDPDGDPRAWMEYPCRVACADPAQGAVQIRAKYSGTEYATFTNVSDAPLDLENYRVESAPHTYVFDGDALLQPGESLRLYTRGSPQDDTRTRKHWGLDKQILANEGDHVSLTTLRYIPVACTAWGRGSCGPANARIR
jgi:endonuclease YncB( thermonuclease family)